MATVKKKRNALDNGILIQIELLDAEIQGMSAMAVGHKAMETLRGEIQLRAAKDSADERIAQAQADKAAATEL